MVDNHLTLDVYIFWVPIKLKISTHFPTCVVDLLKIYPSSLVISFLTKYAVVTRFFN